MRINLTGDELKGIADRLTPRIEATVRSTIRKSSPRRASRDERLSVQDLGALTRELADLLTPVVCPEDALLTASQARWLMGIKKTKWHELRGEGRIPDPVPTMCGDRWYRSTILACMADQAASCGGEEICADG